LFGCNPGNPGSSENSVVLAPLLLPGHNSWILLRSQKEKMPPDFLLYQSYIQRPPVPLQKESRFHCYNSLKRFPAPSPPPFSPAIKKVHFPALPDQDSGYEMKREPEVHMQSYNSPPWCSCQQRDSNSR